MREPRWRDGPEAGRYLRPYAITGGRTRHSQHAFTLITLVVARSTEGSEAGHLEPEAAQILDLCRDRALALAEIAAFLDLPVSVVKVLCGDLLEASLILVQSPPGRESQPSVELIERVMDGIRRL
ncbi:DUF742 domain-containing protein [Streptomyces sp. M2CJ-2]|uniref:DUF742 domain-containing protein n=1 Tax=Streptomyces sp. M2CJ-2 TaxID=2803948 RepID=UPI0019259D2F|nr:DUF742 domain-containing protein [Streptomyces sp. M2CJ-2]MBL3670659.1 DUF742 domain-containing protein [Streptomyces sp. M2CJ-2]